MAPGTYYYAFRFQINGCAWQYGGYSATGGGFWGGANVNGVLTVDGLPNVCGECAASVLAIILVYEPTTLTGRTYAFFRLITKDTIRWCS